MRELLTEEEWRSLKEAWDDFAYDVGFAIGSLSLRAGALLEIVERTAAERVRGFREAMELATQDIADRFSAFEARLTELRPGTDMP